MKRWPVQANTQTSRQGIFPLRQHKHTVECCMGLGVHACLLDRANRNKSHTGLWVWFHSPHYQGTSRSKWLFVGFNCRLAYSTYMFKYAPSRLRPLLYCWDARGIFPAARTWFLFAGIFFAQILSNQPFPYACTLPPFLDKTSRFFLAQFCLSLHFLSPTLGRWLALILSSQAHWMICHLEQNPLESRATSSASSFCSLLCILLCLSCQNTPFKAQQCLASSAPDAPLFWILMFSQEFLLCFIRCDLCCPLVEESCPNHGSLTWITWGLGNHMLLKDKTMPWAFLPFPTNWECLAHRMCALLPLMMGLKGLHGSDCFFIF